MDLSPALDARVDHRLTCLRSAYSRRTALRCAGEALATGATLEAVLDAWAVYATLPERVTA